MTRPLAILHNTTRELRLILVNAVIFLTLTIVGITSKLIGNHIDIATQYLDMPTDLQSLLTRPWTLMTYMFTHTDVWHCVFNMMWLYWFGAMYSRVGAGRNILYTYIAGGVGGALLSIAAHLMWPTLNADYLEGASAAVMAIVAAVACSAPNMPVNLMLLGRVKVKWIALVTLVIFACGLTGSTPGSHLAHLGGMATGALCTLIARYYHRRHPSPAPHTLTTSQARAELDRLLSKVKQSGYSSLTAAERQRLIELSHQV